MTASFLLELDTTPPVIHITAPNYTTTEALTEIHIASDETLANWQDIYLTDGANNRYDLTFSRVPDGLSGFIRLSAFGETIVTVNARVRDDVHNTSALVTKPINVRTAMDVTLVTDLQSRRLLRSESRQAMQLADGRRTALLKHAKRDVTLSDTSPPEEGAQP